MAVICLIFLTGCRTTEYIYPDLIEPEIEPMPGKTYVDGGFKAVESGQFISTADAKILAKYIVALKNWGASGWEWITDYYIPELKSFKEGMVE